MSNGLDLPPVPTASPESWDPDANGLEHRLSAIPEAGSRVGHTGVAVRSHPRRRPRTHTIGCQSRQSLLSRSRLYGLPSANQIALEGRCSFEPVRAAPLSRATVATP